MGWVNEDAANGVLMGPKDVAMRVKGDVVAV
jgi:hypothetical protein